MVQAMQPKSKWKKFQTAAIALLPFVVMLRIWERLRSEGVNGAYATSNVVFDAVVAGALLVALCLLSWCISWLWNRRRNSAKGS
jgi:hypothetical protein